MSVYIQEVLGLLKRNKKKKKLDKMRDHFEFGKLYQTSHLNTGAAYNPKMEPFVIKWGDLVCEATEDLTRTQPGSGNLGFVPVYTTPEGSCSWDTLKDSIITQNAIGDTITINNGNLIVEGDLQVDQNANVNLQLTAGSANILDLTEDRIVIVGPNGELEDDPNFTMDGVTFTALVNVQHGVPVVSPAQPTTNTVINSNIFLNGPVYDSQGNVGGLAQVLVGLADGRVIWSDDDVVEALTYGSLWQGNINDLKQELPIGTADQILISNGVTFSWEDNPAAIVGEQCAVYTIPLWTPDSNTLGCSKLIQDGDNSTPATNVTSSVTFNVINTSADSVINLVNDGINQVNFFAEGNNVFGIETDSISSDQLKIEHFTSEDANLSKEEFISFDVDTTQTNNKLVLGGDAAGGVHPRLADGSVQINVDLELEDVINDDTLNQVLVRDPSDDNIVKWRDALSITPAVGWDVLDPDLGVANWDVNFSNLYMEVTSAPAAFRAIRPNNVTNAQEGYFVFVASRPDIPLDFLVFTGVNGSTAQNVRTTWSGNTALGNPYIPTNQSGGFWQQGTAVKFHWILRVDDANNEVIWWDACCEIKSQNLCPVSTDTTFTTLEDTPITGQFLTSSDPEGQPLTWSIVTSPPASEGTVSLNTATGQYDFTPAVNFCGQGTFTWKTNDGICDSNIATTTYNITCQCDTPSFAVYQGVNQPCGAASVAPVYSGSVGGTYTWAGDYCDPDNAYTDVVLTSEYSTDGGVTWISGLPANFTLQKDVNSLGNPEPWKFLFESSNVPAGNLSFRLTLHDLEVTCNSQYTFNVTAALDILNNFELQVDSVAAVNNTNPGTPMQTRIPYATNTNLGLFGATGGDWETPALPGNTNYMGSYVNPGRRLTYFSSLPSGLPTATIANLTTVTGISADAGTYPGIASATFQLTYITGGVPLNSNPVNGAVAQTPNILVNPESVPADNLISVGDTIIFTPTSLETAFGLAAGAMGNGNLVYEITQEDIAYAPLANGKINIVNGVASAHACNDGAFKLYATITNLQGQRETFNIIRTATSNGSINNYTRYYTIDSYQPPSTYITGANGQTWTRAINNGFLTNIDAPSIVHADDIDFSSRGSTRSISNATWNYAHAYVPDQANAQGTSTSSYTTTGVKRIPASIISQIAADTQDGLVDFRVVGDTWTCTDPTYTNTGTPSVTNATATVQSIGPSGEVTSISLTSSGSNYLTTFWSTNATPSTIHQYYCSGGTGQGLALAVTASGTNGTVNISSIGVAGLPNGILNGGSGYQVGDIVQIDAQITYVANSHGDAAQFRLFIEDPSNAGQQVEVFNGGVWNTGPTATNTTFRAGDGTAVQVDIFNNTVTII